MAKRALTEYKRKRDFSKTPEPGPAVSTKSEKLAFVVQKHAARSLHFDFRLELDGVLLSWAVPKGPSTIAGEKRLAVMTEDHPIEYGKFKGTIPKGNYGAGKVEIWDKGTYLPDGGESEMRSGLEDGKISFILEGKILKGSFALVKMKGRQKENDKNWLLIKHGDDYEYKPSGKKSKLLPEFKPMLCTLAKEPFDKVGFIYEPKFDGIRMLAYIQNGKCLLKSRNDKDITNDYNSIANELSLLKHDCVLDGELGALDDHGTPNFELWQQSKLGTKNIDLVYFVFDLIYLDGKSLTSNTLTVRKKMLKKVLKQSDQVQFVDDIKTDGIKAYKACLENKLEGVVAKVANSVYESGRRSANWIKVKATQSSEYYIIGYSRGTGLRAKTFGALHLGYYDEKGKLQYAGKVGTGFRDALLKDLLKQLKPLIQNTNPLDSGGPRSAVFVEPKLVAEIKYAEKTREGKLRAPVFMHLRDDLIGKVTKSGSSSMVGKQKESDLIEIEGHKIKLTSLSKQFWPDAEITKREYIEYLLGIGPCILPHLKDRPVTLIRYPDGIYGEKFFQKHYPYKLPEFVETVKHYSEHSTKDSAFLMCNNLATLVWFAQIADLEFHVAHTRINPNPDAKTITGKFTGSEKEIENSLLNYPDFMVLDLDPYLYSGKEKKGEEPELHKKGFAKACSMAISLNEMLLELQIKSFVKTSGKTGLHIFIPIKRNIKYEIVRDMAETIGRHLLERHPKDVTMDWSVKKRTGKIFFDHNMNARGKTLASIYSCRNSPIASVSMPLTWEQVESKEVYPLDYHLRNVPSILAEQGDLWVDILKHKNDLTKLLK